MDDGRSRRRREYAESNASSKLYPAIGSVAGLLVIGAIALGVAAFAMVYRLHAVDGHVFCTNSTFYFFDVPPHSGVLGNYSRVSIQQIRHSVTVTIDGVFFYTTEQGASKGWFAVDGFPYDIAIGIDRRCIPPMKGSPASIPDFAEGVCASATDHTILFPPGNMYLSTGQPTNFLSPPAIQFIDGQSGPVACIAHLPDADADVVYRRTALNHEWFVAAQTWIPYGWNVQ